MLTLVASLWWWWVLQQIVSIWSSSQWGMWVWWWWFLLPLESSWSHFDNCWHAFAPCFFLHWAETTYGEYMRRLIESWNYISVCVARNIKDGLIPTLLEQGHLPPYQEAQSPIPPGFEHIHGWGIHSFSGQPLPLYLLHIHRLYLFYTKTVTPCPITTHPCKKYPLIIPVASL